MRLCDALARKPCRRTNNGKHIEAGDLIVQVNRRDISGSDEFSKALNYADFTRGVRLSVVRQNQMGSITVVDQTEPVR